MGTVITVILVFVTRYVSLDTLAIQYVTTRESVTETVVAFVTLMQWLQELSVISPDVQGNQTVLNMEPV